VALEAKVAFIDMLLCGLSRAVVPGGPQ